MVNDLNRSYVTVVELYSQQYRMSGLKNVDFL